MSKTPRDIDMLKLQYASGMTDLVPSKHNKAKAERFAARRRKQKEKRK